MVGTINCSYSCHSKSMYIPSICIIYSIMGNACTPLSMLATIMDKWGIKQAYLLGIHIQESESTHNLKICFKAEELKMTKTSKSHCSVGAMNGDWVEMKVKELWCFFAACPTTTAVQSYFMNTRYINDYKRVAWGWIFKQARLANQMAKMNVATQQFKCNAFKKSAVPWLESI